MFPETTAAVPESTGIKKKSKLKRELKKAGAKTTDDVEFEDLFGADPVTEVRTQNPEP